MWYICNMPQWNVQVMDDRSRNGPFNGHMSSLYQTYMVIWPPAEWYDSGPHTTSNETISDDTWIDPGPSSLWDLIIIWQGTTWDSFMLNFILPLYETTAISAFIDNTYYESIHYYASNSQMHCLYSILIRWTALDLPQEPRQYSWNRFIETITHVWLI